MDAAMEAATPPSQRGYGFFAVAGVCVLLMVSVLERGGVGEVYEYVCVVVVDCSDDREYAEAE